MNVYNYNYQGKRGHENKKRKVIVLPQEELKAGYRNLDDFLRSNSIATTNEYGDVIISGSRIC